MSAPQAPSETDQIHKFNSDLLIDDKDRTRARREYPSVADAFIDDNLIKRFVEVNDLANASKRRSRKSGLAAVVLGVLSLMGLSASPLYHHFGPPLATALDVIAAAMGVASVLIGLFGVLHSRAKENWLASRWETERIRQFHFQYNVAHIGEIVAAGGNPVALKAFLERRAQALAATLPSARSQVSRRLENTLSIEGKENAWLIDDPSDTAEYPSNPNALNSFFDAYRDLRIEHQISYATHVLGRKRGPLRMTLDRQRHWVERAALGCVFLLFVLHLAVVGGGLASWPSWMHEFARSPWTHAISIWAAAIALGTRVLEDGYGLRFDLSRYSDYLFNLNCIAKAYDSDKSLTGRLALMHRTEELAYAEMVSFLRSANNAQYII